MVTHHKVEIPETFTLKLAYEISQFRNGESASDIILTLIEDEIHDPEVKKIALGILDSKLQIAKDSSLLYQCYWTLNWLKK